MKVIDKVYRYNRMTSSPPTNTRDELFAFRRSYVIGDVLCRIRDEADPFFILVKGAIDVMHGEQRIGQITKPGEYFGEMASLTQESRSATLIASAPTTCYVLPIESLPNVLNAQPEIAAKIITDLADRIRQLNKQLAKLPRETKTIRLQTRQATTD